MSRPLSDAEMSALEAAGKAEDVRLKPPGKSAKRALSDDEMLALEKSGEAQDYIISENSRAGQTALETYGNTVTGGYLPHLQAGMERARSNLFKAVGIGPEGSDDKLRAQGFMIDQPESTYLGERDSNLKRLKELQAENPKAALAGTALGLAGTAVLGAGLAPAKVAATAGARIAGAAKAGAAYGALANPGDVEGEINPLQLGDRLKGAAVGAGTGAVVQGGAELARKAGSGLSAYLRDKAAERAAKTLGGTQKQVEKLKEAGQYQAIGRQMLDDKAVPVLGSTGRIAKRIEPLKEQAGAKIGEIVKSAGDKKLVDTEALALQMMDSPEIQALRRTPGSTHIADAAEKELEVLASNGQLDLQQAQKLRRDIDRGINFAKKTQDMRGNQEVLYKIRTAIRDRMNEAINELQPGAPRDSLLKANRRYSNYESASDLLDRQLAREAKNRSFSLTDTIAASGGGAGGGPLWAVAAGAANKAVRTFGNSVGARSMDAASKVLAKAPALSEIASKNPALINRIEETLMGRPGFDRADPDPTSDPEIRLIFEQNPQLLDLVKDPMKRKLIKERLRGPASK